MLRYTIALVLKTLQCYGIDMTIFGMAILAVVLFLEGQYNKRHLAKMAALLLATVGCLFGN